MLTLSVLFGWVGNVGVVIIEWYRCWEEWKTRSFLDKGLLH